MRQIPYLLWLWQKLKKFSQCLWSIMLSLSLMNIFYNGLRRPWKDNQMPFHVCWSARETQASGNSNKSPPPSFPSRLLNMNLSFNKTPRGSLCLLKFYHRLLNLREISTVHRARVRRPKNLCFYAFSYKSPSDISQNFHIHLLWWLYMLFPAKICITFFFFNELSIEQRFWCWAT